MPNNSINTQKLAKDDVIWVSYRKHPLWPALVNHTYAKKVTYIFFPLPENFSKKNTFSCQPKNAYALVTTETIDKNADATLCAAFRAASAYLSDRGKTRGADIESLGEAMARERADEKSDEIVGKKRREYVKKEEEEESDGDLQPPSPKKCASAFSDRSSPSVSGSQQPPITDEQSKEMMKLIDDRFETLLEEIWQKEEVGEMAKQTMKDGKLTVKLRNNQFLSDADYEHLFERIVLHLRHKNPSISLINAFNLTASHVIPHVLITCFAAWKNVDLETAKQIFYQQSSCVLGLDPSMSIPVTDQMEELCRLACDEHQTI